MVNGFFYAAAKRLIQITACNVRDPLLWKLYYQPNYITCRGLASARIYLPNFLKRHLTNTLAVYVDVQVKLSIEWIIKSAWRRPTHSSIREHKHSRRSSHIFNKHHESFAARAHLHLRPLLKRLSQHGL